MHSNPFSDEELSRRLAATREEMAARGLDLILLSAPEHVFYLTGLDHWGYFAPHVLIVAADGELVLVTRAMEHVVIRNQVRNATFIGHSDSESAADVVAKHLKGATSGKTNFHNFPLLIFVIVEIRVIEIQQTSNNTHQCFFFGRHF